MASFLLFIIFTLWSTGMTVLWFLLIFTRFGVLIRIGWSVCISQFQRIVCISFSRTEPGLCIYYLVEWSNFNFLHNSQWITFPTQSFLVLYSFCTSLLHLFIIWLIVLSVSAHNLYLLFCCILLILALI